MADEVQAEAPKVAKAKKAAVPQAVISLEEFVEIAGIKSRYLGMRAIVKGDVKGGRGKNGRGWVVNKTSALAYAKRNSKPQA